MSSTMIATIIVTTLIVIIFNSSAEARKHRKFEAMLDEFDKRRRHKKGPWAEPEITLSPNFDPPHWQ